MHLKSFLGLVEIRTKVASLVPLLLGTAYSLYHYGRFNFLNFILFFCSLFLIDMTTTALNNYFDRKRANKKQGYNYEIHNSIQKYNLDERIVKAIILIMLILAMVLGIILVLHTNLIVFAIGALSFLIGISYSTGPIPVSRTPLGEAFSGFFMGFVILFLAVYIHIYNTGIIAYTLDWHEIMLRMRITDVISIFLVSVPLVCGISNIMLANNICDVEDDLENKRYTLPMYIGKGKALLLFNGLYLAAYADIIILVLAGVLPVLSLAVLLTFLPVYKSMKLFKASQSKKDTFPLSVRNFLLIGAAMILSIFITELLRIFFQ